MSNGDLKNDTLKIEELSREQILDLADAAGRKLGFLLATSPLDDDVKDAIVTILEQATPEQLDQLTELLETGYLEAKTKGLRDFFRSELENIKAESDIKQDELELATLKKLEALENRLGEKS